MKKQILNSIKIITLAALLAVGVSYVSAAPWSAPGTGATGGNTVASVNISEYDQTKIGSFTTNNFFKAGGAFNATGASWNKPGYAVAEKAFISPWSFFTSAFLPGNTSQVKIGGGDDATTDIFNAARTPFTIDLAGRGTGNNSVPGRRVIDIRTDASMCYPNATIRTNTPAIELLNSKTGDNADVIVRGIQLSGGNPAPGKILVSTDANGNAVWGTPTLSGGQIVFTYGTSPVPAGQCVTPQNICNDPSATNYNQPGPCTQAMKYGWHMDYVAGECSLTSTNIDNIMAIVSLSPDYYQSLGNVAQIQQSLALNNNSRFTYYNHTSTFMQCEGQDGNVYPADKCAKPEQVIWLGSDIDQQCQDPQRDPDRDPDDGCEGGGAGGCGTAG